MICLLFGRRWSYPTFGRGYLGFEDVRVVLAGRGRSGIHCGNNGTLDVREAVISASGWGRSIWYSLSEESSAELVFNRKAENPKKLYRIYLFLNVTMYRLIKTLFYSFYFYWTIFIKYLYFYSEFECIFNLNFFIFKNIFIFYILINIFILLLLVCFYVNFIDIYKYYIYLKILKKFFFQIKELFLRFKVHFIIYYLFINLLIPFFIFNSFLIIYFIFLYSFYYFLVLMTVFDTFLTITCMNAWLLLSRHTVWCQQNWAFFLLLSHQCRLQTSVTDSCWPPLSITSQTQRSELISRVKSDRRRFLISAVTHSSSATWTCPSTRRWAGGTPAVPGGASAPSPGRSPSGRWARRWPRPGSPAAWPPAPAATGPAGPPAGCSLEENTMKRKHEQEFKGWKRHKA